jgi:rubrerythrin
MDQQKNRFLLIKLLQLAYSGELAAAYAYRGHWKSVRNSDERDRIRAIEEEEWHHRKLVGEILHKLGERPNTFKEVKDVCIGRVAGFLCHVSGWLAPMYGAGKLESKNIKEYEVAARYSRDCGHPEFIDCLLTMAEVEWEHEKYFRAQILKHRLGKYLPIWPVPQGKENIRAAFLGESP